MCLILNIYIPYFDVNKPIARPTFLISCISHLHASQTNQKLLKKSIACIRDGLKRSVSFRFAKPFEGDWKTVWKRFCFIRNLDKPLKTVSTETQTVSVKAKSVSTESQTVSAKSKSVSAQLKECENYFRKPF